jgi:nucleoside-diphosphate-sugar epimerase
VVCFSSILAYGDQPDLAPVSERTLLEPTTLYGATKAAGDALINAYHAQFGVDAVSLRVAGCYGPGRVTPCLIRQTLEAALRGEAARFRSDPQRTRQFVYVDDVVDAVVAALDAPVLAQRSYNLGPGVAHSLSEVEAAIRTCLPQARIIEDPNGALLGSFGLGVLSIDAARRDLAFSPRMPLAEGVRRTLAWVRQRGGG